MSRVRFSPPVPNQQRPVLIRQYWTLFFVSASLCRRVRNPANKRLHHLHKAHIEIDGHAKSATYFEGGKAVDQTA